MRTAQGQPSCVPSTASRANPCTGPRPSHSLTSSNAEGVGFQRLSIRQGQERALKLDSSLVIPSVCRDGALPWLSPFSLSASKVWNRCSMFSKKISTEWSPSCRKWTVQIESKLQKNVNPGLVNTSTKFPSIFLSLF